MPKQERAIEATTAGIVKMPNTTPNELNNEYPSQN
jgi:hypothetical protein